MCFTIPGARFGKSLSWVSALVTFEAHFSKCFLRLTASPSSGLGERQSLSFLVGVLGAEESVAPTATPDTLSATSRESGPAVSAALSLIGLLSLPTVGGLACFRLGAEGPKIKSDAAEE